MACPKPTFQDIRRLADRERAIIADFPYIYTLDRSPPDSSVQWPSNRLPYAVAELDNNSAQSNHLDPANPYPQFDKWFGEHSGLNGYARSGDVIGIRDQGLAKKFLEWMLPSADEKILKINLAHMLSKLPPGYHNRMVETIGEYLLHELSILHIAALSTRIHESWDNIRHETEKDLDHDISTANTTTNA